MASSLNLFLVFYLSLLTTIPFSLEALCFEKETHLHLYFHETNGGPIANQTIIVVVSPLNASASQFGNIVIVDDILREGPEPTSKLIGRAQGILPKVSQEVKTSLIAANFVFTAGKYNGSTLDVFGRYVSATDTREWSIISGTGQFKLDRGYIHGNKLPTPEGILVIELDIYILHTTITDTYVS